jgi:hypothetical protein
MQHMKKFVRVGYNSVTICYIRLLIIDVTVSDLDKREWSNHNMCPEALFDGLHINDF